MRKWVCLSTLFLAVLVSFTALAQDEVPADCVLPPGEIAFDQYLEDGDRAAEQGDFPQAILWYTCAISAMPENSQGYNYRGLVYSDTGDQDKAIADFTRALELDPENPKLYNNRGLAYYRKRDYDLAINNFDMAIQLRRDYARAFNNRGLAYLDRQVYPAALADFNRAIELGHEPLSWPYVNLGLLATRQRDYPAAIKSYEQAVLVDPRFADAYRGLGDAYYEMARFDDALSNYQRYVELAGDKAKPDVLERIASLDNRSGFVKLLPLLLAVSAAALLAGGFLFPFAQRWRARRAKLYRIPVKTDTRLVLPVQTIAEDTPETRQPSVPARTAANPPGALLLIPVIAVLVGLLLYALSRGRKQGE